VRLIGPQAKRAAAGRLPPGYSGGPGTLSPQNGQAGVHISRPPTSGSDKQATNERMRVVLVSAAGVPESGTGFRADSKDIRQVVA